MLIKYFYQFGENIDKSNARVVTLENMISSLDKIQLIEILEQDFVKINEIDMIRYYDKENRGWRLFTDNQILYFQRENQELKLIIRKSDAAELMETGLIEHLHELNELVNYQDQRIKEIETFIRLSYSGNVYQYSFNRPILSSSSDMNNLDIRKYSSTGSIFQRSFGSFSNDSRLDIAFMYSNPLIKIVKEVPIPLNEPIDFEKEITNLVDTFKNSNKKISARFEIANFENFQEILRKKPKILHISCHGAYGEVDGKTQFFLYFEDDTGKLDKFDSYKLNNLLTSTKEEKSQIDIVFVSACHSEPVADVFRSANIPIVICVHSDTMILDMAAQKFSKIFYESLLDGKTVNYSFDIARKIVFTEFDFKKSKILHCCCFHKHKPDCPWKQRAKKNNEDAHEFHLKLCKCKFGESHMHISNCIWAKDFIEKLQENNKIAKNNDRINQDYIKVCCCSPEIAHNESNKFIMKADPMYENKIIFKNLPNGILDIKNTNFCLNIKFSVDMKTSLIGRNLDLYEVVNIYKNSKKNRLITVCGIPGIGKSAFAKLAAIYLFERRNFESGVYLIETKNSVNEMNLISNLCNTLEIELQISTIQQLFKCIDSKILLIFKFNKNLNKEKLEEFKKFVDKILDNTKLIKILVVSHVPIMSEYENVINLSHLDSYFSAKLLSTLAIEHLHPSLKTINSLKEHELIKISDGIPSKIQQIAGFLQEGIKIDSLIERMKKENLIKTSLSDELMNVLINNMVLGDLNEQTRIHELLYTLLLSPNGLLQRDIIGMYESKTIYCSVLNLLEQFSDQNILLHKKEIKDLSKDVYVLSSDFIPSLEALSLTIPKTLQIQVVTKLLKFYSTLSRNLVLNLYQNESFTEFSAAQNYGIWFSLRTDSNASSSYQFEKLFNPSKHYQHTEGNLMNLLKLDSLIKLFARTGSIENGIDNQVKSNLNYSDNSNLIESIEQLSICVPTILKIMGKFTECMIMIKTFINILNEFNLNLAKGRLIIFSMSIYPALCSISQNYQGNIIQNNNYDYTLFTPQTSQFLEETGFKEGIAEMHFCKAVSMYEIESAKSHHNISKETFIEVNKELEISLALYTDLISNDSITITNTNKKNNAMHGFARVCYVLSDYNIRHKILLDVQLEYLKKAKCIFEQLGKNYKYVKCLLGVSRWYVGKKCLVESKDFAEQALKVATNLRNKIIEAEVKDLLSDIYDSIRVQSHNVFVFVKAHQLVYSSNLNRNQVNEDIDDELNFKRSTSIEVGFNSRKEFHEAVEPLITHLASFRENLIETLSSAQREILVKFDVLTSESFEDIIKKGGRILHLSSDFFSVGSSIYVEGPYGETAEINYIKIQKLLKNSKCLYDLVILSIPQSRMLADIFVNAGVPHVICFDFHESALIYVHKLVYLQFNNIIQDFTINIVNNIIKEKTIEESFQLARAKFLFLFQSMRDLIYFIDFPSDIGSGPILLPLNNNHSVKFYGRLTSEETHLSEGKLMDLSKLRPQIGKFKKRGTALIGRKKEIYFAVKNLMLDNNLNIYGENGVGRSFLAMEIAYFLSVRQKFRDGIFFLDIIDVVTVDGLKDMFENDQINLAIEENKKNKNSTTEDRRILIILDNCDKIIKHCDNQFFLFIFSMNKDNNNSILFLLISHRKILNPNFLCSDFLNLAPLDKHESTYLFLSLCQRNIDKSEIDHDDIIKGKDPDAEFFELIENSRRLKACKGYPAQIGKLSNLTINQSLDRINYESFLSPKFLKCVLEKETPKKPNLKQKTSSYVISKLKNSDNQMECKRKTLHEDSGAFIFLKTLQSNMNLATPKHGESSNIVGKTKKKEEEYDLGYQNEYKQNRTNAYMKKNSKRKTHSNKMVDYEEDIQDEEKMRKNRDSHNSSSSPSPNSKDSSSKSNKKDYPNFKKKTKNFYKDNINYKLANSLMSKRKIDQKDFSKPNINLENHINSFNALKNTLNGSLMKLEAVDLNINFSRRESKLYYEKLEKKTNNILSQYFSKKGSSNHKEDNKIKKGSFKDKEEDNKNKKGNSSSNGNYTINSNNLTILNNSNSNNQYLKFNLNQLQPNNENKYSKFAKTKKQGSKNNHNKYSIFENQDADEEQPKIEQRMNVINIQNVSIFNNYTEDLENSPGKFQKQKNWEFKKSNKKDRNDARDHKFKDYDEV